MWRLCSRFLGQKAGWRTFCRPVQILLSITSFAVQGLSESRIYPRLQSWWSALAQSCPGERSESGVAPCPAEAKAKAGVQAVSEPENCQGAGFILLASAGVRVQVLVGFVMGAGFCKNHEEPINYTVRVMWRFIFFLQV